MVQPLSTSRQITGSPYRSGAPIVRPMGKRTSAESIPSTDTTSVDERVVAFAREIDSLRERRGLTRAALARAAGVHPTQMSQILLGQQGMSIERMADILGALGAALLVAEGDEHKPSRIGVFDASGRLMTDLLKIPLPGYVEASELCADFKAGEQVYVQAATEFELDKWVLAERVGGTGRVFAKCIEVEGARYLQTPEGDDLRFTADRYRVVARAYGRFGAV